LGLPFLLPLTTRNCGHVRLRWPAFATPYGVARCCDAVTGMITRAAVLGETL